MSFLVARPNMPQATNAAEANQQATYKEAEPCTLAFGRIPFQGAHWLSKEFNRRSAYAGANKPEWQYLSIAAGFAIGPMTYINRIRLNGKVAHTIGHTRTGGELYTDFTFNPSLALGQASWARVYWGSETQMPDALLIAGTGQNHPPYRGFAYVIFFNIDLGQGVTAVPQIDVEWGRETPAIGSYAAALDGRYGVNPFAAWYAFALERKGGLGADPALLDAAHWGPLCTALETTGLANRTGALTKMHAVVSQQKDAGQIASDWMLHIDGFIRSRAGKLEGGWFPNRTPSAVGLTEITEADLVDAPSGGGFSDWNKGLTDVVVAFLDENRDYARSTSAYKAPANRETGVALRPQTLDRPGCHADDQAAHLAAEAAASSASVENGTTLPVLRGRAVRPDGSPLRPGDLFKWNYAPHTLNLICRVLERIDPGEGPVKLTIARERGAYPSPFVAPIDARVLPTDAAPGEIVTTDVRLWAVPTGFGAPGRVASLINRAHLGIEKALLSMSPTGAAPWEQILEQQFFVAKCTVSIAISAVDAVVRVVCTSVDFPRFLAQSAVSQSDDVLCLLVDDEVVSVGAMTVVTTNTYDLAILRGRRNTTAAAHGAAALSWLFYREQMQPAAVSHLEFFRTRDGSNVYSAAIATKYFKIALKTKESTGLAKPNDPGIALVLPDYDDSFVSTPTGLTLLTDSTTSHLQPDGTFVPRLKVTLNPTIDPFVLQGKIRFEYKRNADAIWLPWSEPRGDVVLEYITDVQVGVAYDVRVQRENTAGKRSAYATVLNYFVAGDNAAPSAPTGLTATIGTGKAISLDWDDNTADDDFDEYEIERSIMGPSSGFSKIADQKASRFVDTLVTPGLPYWYRVRSMDESNNPSGYSAVVTATPVDVVAGADTTPPSDPAAPTFNSDGSYVSGDGTVFAKIIINLPALPAGAVLMNVLYRRNSSTGWIVAEQNTTGGGTSSVDDLTPAESYMFALQAFSYYSIPSAIVDITGGPFTAPNTLVGPSAPTGGTLSADGIPLTSFFTTDIIVGGTRVRWNECNDPGFAFTEVKATHTDSDAATDYSRGTNGIHLVRTTGTGVFMMDYFVGLFGFNAYIRIRHVNRSLVGSAWVALGNANSYFGVGGANMALQAPSDVKVTGVKTGTGASVRQEVAFVPLNTVYTLTGVSPEEDVDIDVTGLGLTTKATYFSSPASVSNSSNILIRYDWDDAAQSSTNLRLKLHSKDGTNLPAGAVRITGTLGQY